MSKAAVVAELSTKPNNKGCNFTNLYNLEAKMVGG